MQSIKKKQWLILLAIIIIMTALLTLDLKPPGTGNGMRAGAAENKSATADISMDTEIATAKKGFADNTNKMILQLEKELSDLSGNEKELKIKDLRHLMGIVSQEAILFNDTIYNNIVFGLNFS